MSTEYGWKSSIFLTLTQIKLHVVITQWLTTMPISIDHISSLHLNPLCHEKQVLMDNLILHFSSLRHVF